MKHPGRVYSLVTIYEPVWGAPSYGCENTAAVHVRHLLPKIRFQSAKLKFQSIEQ